MKLIFVDTSALIAIGNKRDSFHVQAIKIRNELKHDNTHFIITNAVLLEFGNAFSSTFLKPVAIKFIEAIKQSSKWNCIMIEDDLMEKGFELYKKVHDKDWGLVDCMSIIVAKNMNITEVFTTDHHFEQAEFNILLK